LRERREQLADDEFEEILDEAIPHSKKDTWSQSAKKGVEAAAKAHDISSVHDAKKPISAGMKAINIVGSYCSALLDTAGKVAATAAILGLDKPATLNTATVNTVNPHWNTSLGKGISSAPIYGFDPEQGISREPIPGGIQCDEMDLRYIAGTPCLVTITNWVRGSTAIQIGTTGIDANLAYCDHLKAQHAYWHGSHKFKCYIVAGIFQNVRFVFYWATSVSADPQLVYHRNVEVQGTTEVEIMLPYSAQGYGTPSYVPSGGAIEPFNLYCAITGWSESVGAVSVPVTILTYKAMCEDAVFAMPMDMQYTNTSSQDYFTKDSNILWEEGYCENQSSPRMDFNHAFEPIHPSVTGFGHHGMVYAETAETLSTYTKRVLPMIKKTAAYSQQLMLVNRGSTAVNTHINMYALMYRFWRGAMNVKEYYLTYTSIGSIYAFYAYQSNNPCYLGAQMSNPNDSSVSATIPYHSPVLFDVTSASAAICDRRFGRINASTTYLAQGTGDDFSFSWLVLPPAGSYSAITSTTVGTRGFANFT